MIKQFPKDFSIVVIGGGTGSFNLLSELKKHTNNISAIVNMADDGGSTGVLRDELGVLPPGDVRQCLVALSESPNLRDLFNYRFEDGSFEGHPFGNILLSAIEKVTGSFGEAVQTASDILNIKGSVIPATLDNVRLKMEWPDVSLILQGERVISSDYFKHDPRKAILSLVPAASANPKAVSVIKNADMVIVCPGDLYSSLGPLLVIEGIADSLKKTKALCVYVSNLVTKQGQTEGFTVSDHTNEIERFVGAPFLDCVLCNEESPDKDTALRYKDENAYLVKVDKNELKNRHYKYISGKFLGKMAQKNKADKLLPNRSLIRHDSKAVVDSLFDLCNTNKIRQNNAVEDIEKFYAVDFDRCLGNFEANVTLMNKIVEEHTILNGNILEFAHDEIKAKGTPFRILKYIKECDPDIDIDFLKNTYIKRGHSSPGSLVEPGSIELIKYLQTENCHFCIMTFGDEEWQTTKITAAGLGDIPKFVVSHERKSDKIIEWFDEKSGYFLIPSECFADNIARRAREVILIDDKSNAFVGLPANARGYLVHNEKSIYASTHSNIPETVKRVASLSEIIEHESKNK